MALRSKFVTGHIQKHGVTHFLAIPLVPPTSRSQFRDSFKCLWDDLAAISVPNEAIRSLGLLHLHLGILLRLDTPERMAKATEILQGFSFKKTLPTIHDSSTSENFSSHSSSALPKSDDDANNSMAAPCVSVSSLFCRAGREAESLTLSTKVYDATHRVINWKLRLAQTYQAAGLSPRARPSRDYHMQVAIKEFWDTTVRLVTIPRSGEVTPSKWNAGKLKNSYLPPFDARSLLERYKDHVSIQNIPLERVSICKLGFQKLEMKELPEVVSVPLS